MSFFCAVSFGSNTCELHVFVGMGTDIIYWHVSNGFGIHEEFLSKL